MQHGLPSERSQAVLQAAEAVLADRLNHVRELQGVDWESDDGSGSHEAGKRAKVVDTSSRNTARGTSNVNTTAAASTLESGALRKMGMDPTTTGKGGADAALAFAWDPECVFMDKFTFSTPGLAVLKSDLIDE